MADIPDQSTAPQPPLGADQARATPKGETSLTGAVGDVVALVSTYARQETVDPLKALGRFIAFGIAGGVCLAIGGTFFAVAALRLVQTEAAPHLSGNLTWVPYGAGVLVAGGGALLALLRVGRGPGAHRGSR